MTTKSLDKIKSLRRMANEFAGFHARYAEKYKPDSHCDKKGFGFGRDNRFAGFSLKTSFDSWAGYYGNSSCGSIFNVHDGSVASDFFVRALNVHQEELFATVARLMREEAASLAASATQEIDELKRMLAEVTTPDLEQAA